MNEMNAIDLVAGRDENIIYVSARGPFNGSGPPIHYIDMEYCEVNLENFIYNRGLIHELPGITKQYLHVLLGFPVDLSLDTSDKHYAIEILRQITSGLHYIHGTAHLVHRDIKPRNSNVLYEAC